MELGTGGQPHHHLKTDVTLGIRRSLRHYAATAALVLGVFQVLMGLWSIALGIAHPLTYSLPFGPVGYGIWGGVVYFISGILGMVSFCKRTSNVILAHMVFSIIAAVLAVLQLCLGVAAAYIDRSIINPQNYYNTSIYQMQILLLDAYRSYGSELGPYPGTVVVDSLLAVSAIIEGIIAVAAASLGCKVLCCNLHFIATQSMIDPGMQSIESSVEFVRQHESETKHF